VTQPVQTTWATTDDVRNVTGLEVTQAQLVQAGFCIDLFAARLYEDRDRVGTRDQYWLKQAVAYQAAWLQANPDVFQRILLETSGTGPSSTKFGVKGLVLAPFAAEALGRVSWLRSRSLHIKSAAEESFRTWDFDNDDVDWWGSAWTPVNGV
jgi:hypothetical protein